MTERPLPFTAALRLLSWMVLAAAVASWLGVRLRHGLDVPPPWPDEALFLQPALQFLRGEGWGTPLVSGALPGIEHHTYWVPPLYPLLMTPLVAMVGPDLAILRWSTTATAAAVLVLAWRLGRRLGLGQTGCNLAMAAVALDPLWVQASAVLRMDLLALLWGMASLDAQLQAWRQPTLMHGWRRAGLLAMLAAATHPLGMTALAALAWNLLAPHPAPRRQRWATAAMGMAWVAVPWLLWVAQDAAAFVAQWQLQLARKALRQQQLWNHLRHGADAYRDLAPQMWRLWLWAAAGWAWTTARSRTHGIPWGVALWPAMGVLLVSWSHEMWYPAVLAPATALGLAMAVHGVIDEVRNARATHRRSGLAWVLLGAIVLGQGLRWPRWSLPQRQHQLTDATSPADALDHMATTLAPHLPFGARVHIAAIPDPTTALWRLRSDLSLRQFSPVPLPPGVAEARRRACTWAVYGGVPEAPLTVPAGAGAIRIAVPPAMRHLSAEWVLLPTTP